MRGADYRRRREKLKRDVDELIRAARPLTVAGFAAEWARFDLEGSSQSDEGFRLPMIPRGLTKASIDRTMRALCDLVMLTKPDTSARWYGVLGVFDLLEKSSGEGS